MSSYIGLLRFILPVFAILILLRCTVSLLKNRPRIHKLAELEDKISNTIIDINHWETSIGRSKSCDVRCEFATVSRFHGVISKRSKGWFVTDTFSKTGILVNGEKVNGSAMVYDGDVIVFGNIPMVFHCDEAINAQTKEQLRQKNTNKSGALFVELKTKSPYYLTKKEMIAGRGDDCAIKLNDQSVSKHHCRVYKTSKGWAIADLNSSNGTKLNGRIIDEPQLIFDEDRISFGKVTVIFYER